MNLRSSLTYRLAVCIFAGIRPLWPAEPQEQQPWHFVYTDQDATGPSVIALWQFEPGAETEDSSGSGHALKFMGDTRIAKDGRFGSCLDCSAAIKDGHQGAYAARHPALSPLGAFTAEVWFRLKPDERKSNAAFLLDSKYFHYARDEARANTGYMLYLRRSRRNWIPTASLGFGKDSEFFGAKALTIEPGGWHHIALTYDGAGTAQFFFDGRSIGTRELKGRGPIMRSRYGLAIGDRHGSTHYGFPGYIDQVRISKGVVPFCTGAIVVRIGSANGRTAFVRMERDVQVQIAVHNDTSKTLTAGTLRVSHGGATREVPVPDLKPKAEHTIDLPIDTTVRPDTYDMGVALSCSASRSAFEVKENFPIAIVPRPLPHRMPVVMWGGGDLDTVKDIGFTHSLQWMGYFFGRAWADGKPTTEMDPARLADVQATLNQRLAKGVAAVAKIYPGAQMMRNKKIMAECGRVDRKGKPFARANLCARNPKALAGAYNTAASVVKAFGHFPAIEAVLIDSETRGGTGPCFHDYDKQAFQEHAGYPIPEQANARSGVDYTKIKGIPKKRIIPDDDPILTYYRWFWHEGDGWDLLYSQSHRGIKSTGRPHIWTFHDPAVRVPSVWGSGGEVDVISQWTYCYPDPIKIGQATDELFAMADGAAHSQQVMKMTQIIWKRYQIAGKMPKDETQRAQWERDIPDARFITIAPDCLREALWSKISRPIKGIMYHGWGSLVKSSHPGYQFTNPESRGVLTQLVRDVIRPLGPTLLQVPDRKSDVALLESFTSQIFTSGKRSPWGWSRNWVADTHLILQWAQIQPRIIYDEHILRDGLDDYRVLVMPGCDVLCESVARQVEEFQNRGGIVVADEHLAPAIVPDILIPSYRRTSKAAEDKKALQQLATALRDELDVVYEHYTDSSNMDVVTRCRRYGTTDYLFAVNDKRTFGNYVGHHGKVMEKGLPNSATLSVRRPTGFIYDLVAHKPIAAARTDAGLRFDANFGPCEGKLFMITERKIADVRIAAPAQISLGGHARIDIEITDEADKPVDAIVPTEVRILDPKNRPAEFSGYYGAREGKLVIEVDMARNATPGEWTIRGRELASGRSRARKITVVP